MSICNDSVNTGRLFLQDFNSLFATSLSSEWMVMSGHQGKGLKGSNFLHMLHTVEYGSPSFKDILPFTTRYANTASSRTVALMATVGSTRSIR